MVAIPNRRVVGGLSVPTCIERISEDAEQTFKVGFMSCKIQEISPFIAQNASKTFSFKSTSDDYSLATEITFDVWQGNISGSPIYSASLTGGQITLVADGQFSLTITSAQSGALPIGRHYCEAWVTLPGNARRPVGIGRFQVIDTRKFD